MHYFRDQERFRAMDEKGHGDGWDFCDESERTKCGSA